MKWFDIVRIVVFLFLLLGTSICFAEVEITDELIQSIIKIESGGDPNAVGSSGEIGLMQINRSALAEYNYLVYKGPLWGRTCYNRPNGHVYGCVHIDWTGIKTKEYNEENLFIPEINIEVGTWYLKRLRDHYGCSTIEQVLSAYNGGISRLRKHNYDINKMPKSTQEYVKKVLNEKRRLSHRGH